MKNKKIILVAIVMVVAVALLFLSVNKTKLYAKGAAGQDGAGHEMTGTAEAMVMPATVTIVKRQLLRLWTSYSGRMVAVDYAEIRPEVNGRIEEIKFDDGDLVRKGDVLFVIDPDPYEAAFSEANAALSVAESHYDLAKKDLKRAEELIKTEAISQRVLDERQNAAKIAENSLNAAEAFLEKTLIDLDRAYVKAPISGRVSRAEITVGNLVQTGPNAPVLTRIVSHEGIYADFEVDEQTYLNNVRRYIGNSLEAGSVPVEISLNDKVYKGYIKSFDNHINVSTGTIRARARFENKDGLLLPGMFVTVKLGTPKREDVIVLTEQAIGTDQDRKFVYVVDNDNKVTYRVVTLGASVNGSRIITSGLVPGEKVIIEGIMKVMPDMVVSPQIKEQAVQIYGTQDPVVKDQMIKGQMIKDQPVNGDSPEAQEVPAAITAGER